MRVTILGASGFIGRHLAAALRARGDVVVTASLRDPARAADASAGSDVVVNLAGAPVSVRWTDEAKRAMVTSRVDAPRAYLAALARVESRPRAYVSASAVGYYGTSRTARFTEASPPGSDFLARLCVDWEAASDTAAGLGMRVAKVRTGLVLGSDGGVLAKLLPIFRFGLGGVVASGAQWYSWISIDDQIGIYLHAIDGADGVLNATAPNPVTNRDFTHALGRALGRPTLAPMPAFAGTMLLGEGAVVINEGQCVIPERTQATGYVFRHPELDEALRALFRRAA
ncbi:epimerase [Vulcanimicrobium alpinum]|uniref:Epimerase n=1 Tax=Vulcanimicrobium alpinum TaxID=3016050 RepID=A0AAN1XU85_UNVUL|nr:TIGR01777 family oxidoreductase [Vulcanimicrobium alpinum]BDE05658.1 epimerase [Vulcanimicrobium alpinum]